MEEYKKQIIKILLIFIFLITLPSDVISEDTLKIRYFNFWDNWGVKVYSPTLILNKDLTKNLSLSLRYTYERLKIDPVDAVTGATPISKGGGGGTKERDEITLGASYKIGTYSIDMEYYRSDEGDYLSNSLGAHIAKDLFAQNTTLALKYSYTWDEIEPFGEDWTEDKDTNKYELILTQLLSPKTIVQLSYAYSDGKGYFTSPYRSVIIGGGIFDQNFLWHGDLFDERRPSSRYSHGITTRLNQYLPFRSSIQLEYRYYWDSWDMDTHSFGVDLNHYLMDDLILNLKYDRFHQKKAYFYDEIFGKRIWGPEDFKRYDRILMERGGDPFRTINPNLSRFDENHYGVKLTYNLGRLSNVRYLRFLRDASLNLSYDNYKQTTGHRADIYLITSDVPFNAPDMLNLFPFRKR